ncbi:MULTISPECIES: hypothetical protein [unclassified Providencia]|uniref:hypothetical protein n=1 Tax=unclassified Providencia TaxID=2633465 RepID=UPI00234988C8|nr:MULTISPECIES: hypothetical protein [unclassified Providencia]WOB97874.1 hypothetical protein P3L55_11180 [Providencia sp. PROV046]
MNRDDIFKIIENSFPEEWNFDDRGGIYAYLKDLDVTIKCDKSKTKHDSNQDWVDIFYKIGYCVEEYNLYYKDLALERFRIIHLDEYRAMLPLPEDCNVPIPHGYKFSPVKKEHYDLAKLMDNINNKNSKYEYFIRILKINII